MIIICCYIIVIDLCILEGLTILLGAHMVLYLKIEALDLFVEKISRFGLVFKSIETNYPVYVSSTYLAVLMS
jgi:hypothetical protein